MSELQVKENKFYLLIKKDGENRDIRLYVDMDVPIKRIKNLLKEGMETNNIELVSIELKGEKYLITGIPWSVIASKLVKE